MIIRLLLVLAVAACGKTSDVGAMQDEALGTVTTYKARFDMLDRRMHDIDSRAKRLSRETIANASDLPQLQRIANETNHKLSEMKSFVLQAPNQVATAAKGENPRAELIKVQGELGERLHAGYVEINTGLDTVESWIANIELRPKAAPAQPTSPPGHEDGPNPGASGKEPGNGPG